MQQMERKTTESTFAWGDPLTWEAQSLYVCTVLSQICNTNKKTLTQAEWGGGSWVRDWVGPEVLHDDTYVTP